MSKNNEDIKNEIQLKEQNTNINNQDNNIDSIINLKIDNNNQNPKNNNNDIESNKEMNIDQSLNALKNERFENETISKLNVKNQPDNKLTEKKQGIMQNTKSWISKTWSNIKNYDYSKWNIFKGEEMEEILDAHGFPMKIPKRRHNQNPPKDK